MSFPIVCRTAVAVSIAAVSSFAQGVFVYDQQAADENTIGGFAAAIQPNQPVGQSFTPTITSVGFIRLKLSDSAINGLGATVYLNLRSDSISGPILATSDSVVMPDGFAGYPNFYFVTPVPVTPGTTYFLDVIASGDLWAITGYNTYNYAGGTAFGNGIANPASDLWFREGIVVPEPSLEALFLVCGIGSVHRLWKRRRYQSATSL